MNLSISKNELLNNVQYELVSGHIDDFLICDIFHNTKDIIENSAFVCIKGERFDSHDVIKDIIEKGAKLIVIDHDINDDDINLIKKDDSITLIKVESSRKALSLMSINYFRNPSKGMHVIGVTGTKGKTTTTMIIKQVLEKNNIKCGLIGTIGVFIGDEYIPTQNTTPESYLIQKYFYMMKEKGYQYVCMEVSSQSLMQYRVCGINYEIAVFTNIYEDHIGIGEHKDFEDYFSNKLKLFIMTKFAIVNKNMNRLSDVIKVLKNNNVSYDTFDVSKALYKNYEGDKYFGAKFTIEGINNEFDLSLPGGYNVENTLCAMKVLLKLGISIENIKNCLDKISIKGRTEIVYKDDDFTVMTDYAHNALGTTRLLETMRQYHKKRYVVVFGCGGGRDKERRYGMGKVCGEMADFSVVTADNSRFEKTIDIINDILSVLKKYTKNYVVYEDRRDAIEYAVKNYEKGDIIMVIGKGHEDYNDFNGVRTHFSDKEEILKVLKDMKKI